MFALKTQVDHDDQKNPQGHCPCCGSFTHFVDGGIQKVPAKVAALTGLPEELQLWTCTECNSTISETDLFA